jgi:hypothetical protein
MVINLDIIFNQWNPERSFALLLLYRSAPKGHSLEITVDRAVSRKSVFLNVTFLLKVVDEINVTH